MDAGTALQAAVFLALTADPPIGANVADSIPNDAQYPQIEIVGGISRTWRYQGVWGEQPMVEIHVWSRYNGYKEARSLMSEIRNRLDEIDLALNGVALVDIQFYNEDLMMDVDMMTRHGIVRLLATVVVPR
jgi:hypothetical protein